MNQPINFFYLLAPNATIYNISLPVTYPMVNRMWIYPRPDESKCPVCHDKNQPWEFYNSLDPLFKPDNSKSEGIYKDNCPHCAQKGLHPMPLTEFWDELSYDAVDLP